MVPMEIPVNKYQTEITEDLLESLPEEVREGLLDAINNIEFVRYLISPNRGYAKDRPRDKDGKIIVDIVHPHILEDMDYFRPAAIHFEEYGCYTNLKPNSNQNSEYGKWLRRERDRCWNGYIRESDGEWVTGLMYFYLNYGRMTLSKIRKGTKQADRIEAFPEVWEGIYWRYHIMDQARNGGLYNNFLGGNHCAELAARGKAFAYSQDVETPDGRKKWGNIKIGDILFSIDGTTTKVIDIPFDEEWDVYKMVFTDGREVLTTKEHLWKVYRSDDPKEILYTTGEIMENLKEASFYLTRPKGVDHFYKEKNIVPHLYRIEDKESYITQERLTEGTEVDISIKGITYSHREKCKCVTVDREDGMFLIGDFIPTHNSKSYSMAATLGRNFILGENAISHRNIRSFITAYQKEFLVKDGTLNKFLSIVDFCATHTQFPRRRLKDSLTEMTWIMGYKDAETNVDRGTNNSVLGVAFKDDVGKIRGKRASYIGIEEFGSAPKLLDLYNVMLPSVQDGDYTFGLMYLQGTAAEDASDFTGAQEIMYNPRGYNMYAFPNVWDKNNQGKKEFIFFFAGYVNRKGCMNEDGVSDVVKALIEILMNRYRVKYNSSDPNTILRVIAENPITPAEAIIKVGVNMFPVTDLTERLLQIDNNPSEYDDVYTGELTINGSGEVEYKMTSVQPIRNFPHKDNKILGALEIYQLPEVDKSTKKVFSNRYILGCLKEGELVNTNNGFKKVEDITLRDKLVNIDGEYVQIYNLQKYMNIESVYKVKLASILDTTTFSAEHPIYCYTPENHHKYNFDFRKVSELKVGDIVKSPILYTEETKINRFNNSDIWYLIGVILGNGYININSKGIDIDFNREEKDLIDRCKNIIENILNSLFILEEKDYTLKHSFCHFYHKELTEFISTYFGGRDINKHIDFSLKTLPYEYRKNLILGYIDSVGCIYKNTLNITSTSKTLLCDIQDWLFSMRIVSSVEDIGKTYLLSIDSVGLNTIKDWGIRSIRLNNYTKVQAPSSDGNIVFEGNYMYIKVESIDKEKYVGDVYNFECDTHTFMCNYIPTHNCDPYDDDTSSTMSLGSIFVLDLWTDRLVAEYTGRPSANEFYEICRRLTLFYNGSLLYENNKKGLFAYFSTNNSLYLLADQPEFLRDKQMIKDSGIGNKKKGVNATAPINNYARTLLRDWLVQPVNVSNKNKKQETEVTIPNLFLLRNRALIQELINYNSEGNFDRISAMGMLMLIRQEKMILYQGNLNSASQNENDINYLGNDPFFSSNYRSTKITGY